MKVLLRNIVEAAKSPMALALLVGVLIGGVVVGGSMMVGAESYPGGTENGKTSRIKQLNDDLETLGYGSPSNTPDWGANWNRIVTSAQWTPDGDTTPADVVAGKAFYGNSRTQQTGARPLTGVCPTQSWHDLLGNQANNCALDWVDATPSLPGDDKKDPNTGLVWSKCLLAEVGVIDFSSTTSCTGFSWDNTRSSNSGRTAIQLCSDRGGDWRLPTQKELMQAYIDGSNYNLVSANANYWSATEDSATAWYTTLSTGLMSNSSSKSFPHRVRCVR